MQKESKMRPATRMKSRSIQKNAEVGLASTSLPSACDFPIPLEGVATCVACFMRTFKLLIFFNLVFIPVLVLSFFGAAYIVRGQLQESAEQQVLENSRHDADRQSFPLVYDQTDLSPCWTMSSRESTKRITACFTQGFQRGPYKGARQIRVLKKATLRPGRAREER